MLDVGLIGLGPDWESRYRPVLERLRHRLRVRAIYSAVSIRAEPAAEEFQCGVSHGFLALMRRPDIRALLLLDAGWIDPLLLIQAACEHNKPMYLGRPYGMVAISSADLLRLGNAGLVTPEMAHRYTPATSRLRELIASRLGRPLEIRIATQGTPVKRDDSATQPLAGSDLEFLRQSLDWCAHLVGTPPVSIASSREDGQIDFRVEFRRPAKGGDPPHADIEIPAGPARESTSAVADELSCAVRCAAGRAEIQGLHTIDWEHQGQTHHESLAAERGEIEVLLDHFCRRVVGGLIPVPTLDDLVAAERLCAAAEQSVSAGTPVRLGE